MPDLDSNRFKHWVTYVRFDHGIASAEKDQQRKSAAVGDEWLMLVVILDCIHC